MGGEPSLVFHLATALCAALLGGFLAAALRQSVLVGYLMAGIVIGPFTPGFIGDTTLVEELAEIGIIFLMFAIGVQFSMRELMREGRVALLGAALQVLLTMAAGYGVGRLWGWAPLESLFFGAVASNSSSTVLGKVLSDRDAPETKAGRIAIAWSSVQDLSTIAIVAVLGMLAAAHELDSADLGWTIGKPLFFLGVLVPLGLLGLPRFLLWVAGFRSRELFVLSVGCIALGLSYVSALLGVSAALGAFLAGAVVGDSELAHRIQGEALPLRDLFSGLFFVSVGMLVDPRFIASHLGQVLIATAVIIVVKGLITALVARSLRCTLPTAIGVALGLAQSGEFSLLMARLGAEVDAVSASTFNVILGATALSIVLAPQLARLEQPLARFVNARSHDTTSVEQAALRDHAIVCGHGRVGRVVTSLLSGYDMPVVVIEENEHIARALRQQGVAVLVGDAARPFVLDKAGIARARLVLSLLPDRITTRRLVDQVRALNPEVPIVARTHSDSERAQLYEMGVNEAVHGELELALEVGRRALELFGVEAAARELLLDQVRRGAPHSRDDFA